MSGPVTAWSIPGADGEPIIGNAHRPDGASRGVVLLAHGFKGYKDYGMFPFLAAALAAAGFTAHRFNFSHSGMTNEIDSFARADLFERDTWNRQVDDLHAVQQAVADGTIPGQGEPLVIFGHSRGGVTTLLAAGRAGGGGGGSGGCPAPAGLVTASAPSRCNSLDEAASRQLLADGFLPSPSSRTGQALRVGAAFLQDQIDDPAGHDLPAIMAAITCPVLVVHGADDVTVPAACADEIAAALGAPATVRIVAGADHVFNTPNPMPPDAAPSAQLQTLVDEMITFASARA